ncbi:MAG: hypothetical protein NVSMB31_06900 [Vulcanimicrobiaceae bacterium]
MKTFLAALFLAGCAWAMTNGLGAQTQTAGMPSAPVAPSGQLSERLLERVTGQLTELHTATLPAEFDSRIPLPRNAQLIGSVVLTPHQYYGDFGSRGTIEVFYDTSGKDAASAYAADLQRSGWQPRGAAHGGAALFCRSDAPPIVVFTGPEANRLGLEVYRNHPGVNPCAAP